MIAEEFGVEKFLSCGMDMRSIVDIPELYDIKPMIEFGR